MGDIIMILMRSHNVGCSDGKSVWNNTERQGKKEVETSRT